MQQCHRRIHTEIHEHVCVCSQGGGWWGLLRMSALRASGVLGAKRRDWSHFVFLSPPCAVGNYDISMSLNE